MKKLYTHHSIYLLFAVCWLSYFSAYLGRLNFTACIAAINEAENLSRLELGRVSSAFFVCYGGAQLFSGLLADRLRPRLLVAVGLLGGAAVNLGMAVSSTAGQMAVLWAANGGGGCRSIWAARPWPRAARCGSSACARWSASAKRAASPT